MSGAEFTIDGDAYANLGYDALNSQVLDLALEDTTDVRKVVFSQVQKSKDAPDLVFVPASGQPATPGGTVTCTMPAAGGHSYILRAQINDGISADAKSVAAWTKERLVAVRIGGYRKTVPAESTQYDGTYGWSGAFDELVDAIAIGALPGGAAPNEALVADGAGLPTWSPILDVHVDPAAGIAGTKVAPDFGAQDIVTTGVLSIGASPSSTGHVRLPNDSSIRARNTAGTGDVYLVSKPTGSEDVHLGFGGATGVRLYGDGAMLLRATTTHADLRTALSLNVGGAGVSTGGDLRLRAGFELQARNWGNSANLPIVKTDSTDNILIGGTGVTEVQTLAGGNLVLRARAADAFCYKPLAFPTAGTVTTLATTGTIRGLNDFSIVSRNAANSANISVLLTNGADEVRLGDGAKASIILGGTATAFRIGATDAVTFSLSTYNVRPSALLFFSSTLAPRIGQADNTTASATGETLRVEGQSCTGSLSTGGSVHLVPGTGLSAGGEGKLLSAIGSSRLTWDDTGIALFGATPAAQSADMGVVALDSSVAGADTIDVGACNSNFDALNGAVNAIRDCLRALGAMA